jgi:hypothetical protein
MACLAPQSTPSREKVNPLPHGVLATFSLTAGGPIGPPRKDDISIEKTILMTPLRTHWASAVSREGLYYTFPPPPTQRHERSLCTERCDTTFAATL